MRGVDREQEHTLIVVTLGQGESERRRARGLAHAALARDDEQPQPSRRQRLQPPVIILLRLSHPARRGGSGGKRNGSPQVAKPQGSSQLDSSSEPTKRGDASWLGAKIGRCDERTPGEGGACRGDHAGLAAAPHATEVAAARRWRRDAVHDDLGDGHARVLEGSHAVTRLLERRHLGEQHPRERAALGIAQQCPELGAFAFDLGDERIGGIGTVLAAEALGQEAVLGQHAVEHARDPSEDLGHGQQPQRVPGGRRVHDDVVPRRARHQPLELHETDELVDAGQGQGEESIDVVVVEIGPASHDRA